MLLCAMLSALYALAVAAKPATHLPLTQHQPAPLVGVTWVQQKELDAPPRDQMGTASLSTLNLSLSFLLSRTNNMHAG